METEESPELMAESSFDNYLTVVLGDTLRKRRLEMGLSLERLAQSSGVSRGMLGLIESGKTTPSIGILWKISKVLRIPVGEMIPDLFHQIPKFVPKGAGKPVLLEKNGTKILQVYSEDQDHFLLFELFLVSGKTKVPSVLLSSHNIKLYCLQGKVTAHLNTKAYELQPADSLFFPASEFLHFSSELESSLLWIATKRNR